ncbi:hypothetical protein [Escherichia phage IMM-001]|nr:hypothetical protein [Escherichia phage IMM-001]
MDFVFRSVRRCHLVAFCATRYILILSGQ